MLLGVLVTIALIVLSVAARGEDQPKPGPGYNPEAPKPGERIPEEWFRKWRGTALTQCKEKIEEQLLAGSASKVRWLSGIFGSPDFTAWINRRQDAGHIFMFGDNLEIQGKYDGGRWSRVHFMCAFNPDTLEALWVRTRGGPLPDGPLDPLKLD
jgi:hypothetical protein